MPDLLFWGTGRTFLSMSQKEEAAATYEMLSLSVFDSCMLPFLLQGALPTNSQHASAKFRLARQVTGFIQQGCSLFLPHRRNRMQMKRKLCGVFVCA